MHISELQTLVLRAVHLQNDTTFVKEMVYRWRQVTYLIQEKVSVFNIYWLFCF